MKTEQPQWSRCASERASVWCLLLTWIYWCETASENQGWSLALLILVHSSITHARTHTHHSYFISVHVLKLVVNIFINCVVSDVHRSSGTLWESGCSWQQVHCGEVRWVQALFCWEAVLRWLCRRCKSGLTAAEMQTQFSRLPGVNHDAKMTVGIVTVRLLQKKKRKSVKYKSRRQNPDEDWREKWLWHLPNTCLRGQLKSLKIEADPASGVLLSLPRPSRASDSAGNWFREFLHQQF